MSKSRIPAIAVSVLIASACMASVALAAFKAPDWHYMRDIQIPVPSGFVKITLPDTVSRGGNDFSDVRIITQDAIEVPYFITRDAVVHGGEVSTQILDQTVVNGSDEFIVDTGGEGNIHTGMRLTAPLSDFRRRVSVYSSSSLLPIDGPGWNVVTASGYIFKFTDPNTRFTSGKDGVDFPANTARYLKVVIDPGTEGPVAVSAATTYSDVHIDVPVYQEDIPVSVFNDPQTRSTRITLDLGESGHITDAVTLSSTDDNYSRRVIIESSDSTSTASWTYVAEGSISNISTSLFTGTSLRVTYPEQKTRYIRVSIVNDDNRPLSIGPTALVEGPIVSAIFEARPGESYRLYYGDPAATTPVYDITQISNYIEANALPAGSLGPETVNPLYVAPVAPVVPFTEAHSSLLDIFLTFIVIVLGGGIAWYLYHYMHKGGFTPEE